MNAHDHVPELLFGGPAGSLAQAAIGREGEAIGRRVLEAGADAAGDVLRSFDVITFHIDDADGGVFGFGDGLEDLEFGEFAAGHFDVYFIDVELKEGREHGGVLARTDRAGFVIAEAEVGGEVTLPHDRLDGAIEDLDESFGIFLMGVAAHRGFIDGDLAAAGIHEPHEFVSDDGEQGFGESPAIGILFVWEEAAAQGVGAGNAGLEGGSGRGEALEPLKIGNGAESFGSGKLAGDLVFAALIVSGRTESAGGGGFEFDAGDEPVKGKVEIEAGLLAVGNDVKASGGLVVDGDAHGVVDKFLAILNAELIEVSAGEFQPAREGVAADDSGS